MVHRMQEGGEQVVQVQHCLPRPQKGRRAAAPIRPLTDWELLKVCNWWRGQRSASEKWVDWWCAMMTVAYFACWRASQYSRSGQGGPPWRRWLVRRKKVALGKNDVAWIVPDQKTGRSYRQKYYRDGPAEGMWSAVQELVRGGGEWLCTPPGQRLPATYVELLEWWQQGVKGAELAVGVEGLHALRRGGATFWSRVGLSHREVALANGWTPPPKSNIVKRYILRKLWLKEEK